MQTLEATYEIVTPMFIGGGHVTDDPEIRPPTIKGALRFWWRALNWGRCLHLNQGNVQFALQTLYAEEAVLFGVAIDDKNFGQGICKVKLLDCKTQGVEQNWPCNNDAGAGFLGYGLDATQAGTPHRKAIAGGKFTISLLLKTKATAEQRQQLQQTLLLFGLLGGLGSRSRRGFGSVAIERLNDQQFTFTNHEAYVQTLKSLISDILLAPSMPIYTALNTDIVIAHAGHSQNARHLMNRLGNQYREARRQAGRDLAKLPFGLPLAGKRGAGDQEKRRSSPLLMHIHPVANEFVALLTFIPAQFHPAYPKGNQLDFYRPVQTFMDTLERVYP